MKIKKKEYKKKIEDAFMSGLRIGVDNPTYARMYLADGKIRHSIDNVTSELNEIFKKIKSE